MLDLSRDVRPAPESIRTLERFDVPFAVFSRDGRQTYVSPEARAILDPAALESLNLWRQVSQAMLGASARARRDSGTLGLRYSVVVRPIPDGGPQHAFAAVFGPASPRHDAGDEGELVPGSGLTPREVAVARLIASGHSNKEVGEALGISPHTARRHTERVYRKLGVSNRARLAHLLSSRAAVTAAVA